MSRYGVPRSPTRANPALLQLHTTRLTLYPVFHNLINMGDATSVLDYLRREGFGRVMGRLFAGDRSRVRSRWSHVDAPLRSWLDIPGVVSRRNGFITGDPRMTIPRYVTEKYSFDGRRTRALSLGCGNGRKDLMWIEYGAFARLDACDISPERIRHANARAEALGYSGRVHFFTADAREYHAEEPYDAVILDEALHHLSPVRQTLQSVRDLLLPGGLLILNDYVGPSRFQWTDRQISAVERALSVIPARYRTTESGRIKRRLFRPGRLMMYLHDPSEAAESDLIIDAVRESFTVVEYREYGGTILHPLLKDIAHNFLSPEEETDELLKKLFALEDGMLSGGGIPSDFVFLVARRPAV